MSTSNLINSVIIVSVTIFLFAYIRPTLRSLLSKWPTQARFVGTVAQVAILGSGAKILVDATGYTSATLLTIVAIFSIAVSLAMESTISDIVSSGRLIARGLYEVGDMIEIDGTFGKVAEVNSFATIIENEYGDRIFIPNTLIVQDAVRVLNIADGHHIVPVSIPVLGEHDQWGMVQKMRDAAGQVSGYKIEGCSHSWQELGDSVVDVYTCRVFVPIDDMPHLHNIRSQIEVNYAKQIRKALKQQQA